MFFQHDPLLFPLVAKRPRAARRSWSLAEKRAIVLKLESSKRSVKSIAREHSIAPTLLYQWRKQFAISSDLHLISSAVHLNAEVSDSLTQA